MFTKITNHPIKLAFLFLILHLVFFHAHAEGYQAVDLVTVKKSQKTMILSYKGKTIKRYQIALGRSPRGRKIKEGDHKTPEGRYFLDYKKANSSFYKAIHISYPNQVDIKRAKALGVEPGGQIMIHGQKNNTKVPARIQQKYNWTNGCIALTNGEMDELWRMVAVGTPIEIWP